MSTYLELCALCFQHSGVVPRAPTTVVGQTGRQGKLVASVNEAWQRIQRAKGNWFFMKGQWTGTMTIADMIYFAGDAGWTITRFGEWIGDYKGFRPTTIYDPAIGLADESPIDQISWERWRQDFDRGVHDATRPNLYCLAPDGSIRFGPKPSKAYVARGEYRKTPQVLAIDADVPDFPARFHMIIVWLAIMMMAEQDLRVNGVATARGKYAELMGQMNRDLLPSFNLRARRPLA